MLIDLFLIFILFLLGLSVGSFSLCYAVRYSNNESIIRGRSHCDLCGHILGVFDIIPVISYITHKGKCGYCGCNIGKESVLCELLGGILFAVLYIVFGFSFELLQSIILTSVLMIVAFTDIKCMRVPLIPLAVALIFGRADILFYNYSGNERLTMLADSLIGGIAVFLLLFAVAVIFNKINKTESLGGGDIMIFAVLGFCFGWKRIILCLILSCVIGIVFNAIYNKGKKGRPFPLCPSIAIASYITLIFGDKIVEAYLNMFGI